MIGPVYHASVLPRSLVLQAPIIHVGTLSQATVIYMEERLAGTTNLFFRKSINGVITSDIRTIRVHHNGASIFEFGLSNTSVIFKNVLNDDEANAVHMLHAQKYEYPISTSVCNSSPFFTKKKKVLDALNALVGGAIIPYVNVGEGRMKDMSYLVPNPNSLLTPSENKPFRCTLAQLLNGTLDLRNDR